MNYIKYVLILLLFAPFLVFAQIQTSSDPNLLQNTWQLALIELPDQPSTSSTLPPANQQSFLVFQGGQECTYLFLYGVLNLRQCTPFTANESTLTDQSGTYNWQIATGNIKIPLALFLTINDPEVSQKTGLPVGTKLGYVGNSSLPLPSNPTLIQGTWKLKIVTGVDPSTGQPKIINPPADESAYGVFQGNQVCDYNFKGKVLKEKKCASFSIDGFNFSREGVTFNWGMDSNGYLELITIDGKIGAGLEKSTLPSAAAPSPPPSTQKPSPTAPAPPSASVEKTPEAAGKTDASISFIPLGIFFAGIFLFFIATLIFKNFFARLGWIKRDESGKPLWTSDWSGWTSKGKLSFIFTVLILVGGTLAFVGFQELRKGNLLYDAYFEEISTPKKVMVGYKNKEGQLLKVPTFDGIIAVLVEPGISLKRVRGLVSENGGKIIGQMPVIGYYVVQVNPGRESDFIQEMFQEPVVRTAFPHILLTTNVALEVDNWSDRLPAIFHDAAGNPYFILLPREAGGQFRLIDKIIQSATHGEVVRYFLKGKNVDPAEQEACQRSKECIQLKLDRFDTIKDIGEAIDLHHNDPYITVNMSFGGVEEDLNGTSLPPGVVRERNFGFLFQYMNMLEQDTIRGIDRTILIHSAGNAGQDLTHVFNVLKGMPNSYALDRLISVGAVDEQGKLLDYSNYSTDPRDIIYVPVKEKTITGFGPKQLLNGTSFAAPQISYLVNKVLEAYPELAKEPKKIKEVLFHSSVAKLKSAIDPKTGKSHPLRYFIDDPYDPQTFENALKVAKRLVAGLPAEETPQSKEKRREPVPPKPAPAPSVKEEPTAEPPALTPPPLLPTPLPPPSASTPIELTVQSTSCVPAGGTFDENGMFTVTLKGTARGPVETELNVSVAYIPESLTFTQTSWTRGGSSRLYTSVFRGSNDPETTSWTIEGIYRGFGGFRGVWLRVSLTNPLWSNVPGKTQEITVPCK